MLGPCQIETLDHARYMAENLCRICDSQKVAFIYKSSFDKANRSSLHSPRGVGIEEGLSILSKVKAEFNIPVMADGHHPEQMALIAEVCDIIQIPAFLSRQTDLLMAAGETGCIVNVKKGQFLAPHDMVHVAEKIAQTGNKHIILTERGTSFGYNMLVSDMRSLPIMAETGYPIAFDVTHSLQLPSAKGSASGGQRQYIPHLARAAVSVGVAAVFMETHQNPETAPCDGANMLPLAQLEALIAMLVKIDRLVKGLS